jgi:hypothetical protein
MGFQRLNVSMPIFVYSPHTNFPSFISSDNKLF